MTINNTSKHEIINYLVDSALMDERDAEEYSTQELRDLIKEGGAEEIFCFNSYVWQPGDPVPQA